MLYRSLTALVVAGFFADTTLGGSLWAGATLDNNVYELNSADGQILSSIPGPGEWTDGVSWQTDGSSLWIADSSNNSTIYQINPSGGVITSFFTPIDAEGIEYLSDGTIAVAAGTDNQVVFFDSNGNQTGAFPTSHGSFGIDSHLGTLWVLDIDGTIYEYDTLGNLQIVIDTAVTENALGLAYNSDTGGFFVSQTGSTIYELDSAGAIINSYPGPDGFTEALDYFPPGGCFEKISEEVLCHADGSTFTYTVEGMDSCSGGISTYSFTASGAAVGEEMCFTLLITDDQGGLCCSIELCVAVPDCSSAEILAIETGTEWQNSTINVIPGNTITVVNASELMTINFNDYDILYVSDVWDALSTPDWASALNDRSEDIREYVDGGGLVLVGGQNYGDGPTNGDEYNFLGELADAPAGLEFCEDDVVITEPDHPLFNGLTSEDLSTWLCSYHGILAVGTLPVLATNSGGDPVIRGGPVGAGGVFVWTLDPDFHYDEGTILPALALVENAVALNSSGCLCDLDWDNTVGITDFLALLAAWGTNPGGPPDFDGDQTVGITDFLELLANWGPCP